jgi:hypothetical protein
MSVSTSSNTVIIHPSSDQVFRLYPLTSEMDAIKPGSFNDALKGRTVRIDMGVLRASVPADSPHRAKFTPKARWQLDGKIDVS